MRLAFIDTVYHYNAARPDGADSLGGTTSAVCFLARAFVTAGHQCAIFNRVDTLQEAHGIKSLPIRELANELANDSFDAYIFCGRWSVELVSLVRANTKRPLIAWMHESVFAPPMTPPLDEFDGVVFVSEWQQRINQNLAKSHWRQTIIRNAMNPAAAQSFPAGCAISSAKSSPPVLIFAGSFARGAAHVPPILEKIRAQKIDFHVEMFCNKNPSRNEKQDGLYMDWLHSLPNITHVGMVGQNELAVRMKRAQIFLSPNPWPETSCIALIEALASGMIAITTNRAALPETSSGFARHLSIDLPDEPLRFDMPVDHGVFAKAVIDALNEIETGRAEQDLRRQVDYFHTNYQWQQRVAQWQSYILSMKSK